MTTPNRPKKPVPRPTGQGMRLTREAHADLTRLKFALIAEVRHDVSLSDALRVAVRLAFDDMHAATDKLGALLAEDNTE